MDRDKIIKMVVVLAAIVVIAASLSKYLRRDSMSLTEYARLQDMQEAPSPGQSPESSSALPHEPSAEASSVPSHEPSTEASSVPSHEPSTEASSVPSHEPSTESSSALPHEPSTESSSALPHEPSRSPSPGPLPSPDAASAGETPSPSPSSPEDISQGSTLLTGASLNGDSQLEQRVLLEDGFYYEPLSAQLCRYITGVSYPASDGGAEAVPEITLEELRYVHILHYDFDGNPSEGELICNESIAQDLVEIFHELYRNEYQLEKVLLIDEYDGDDNASMEDNNTSCFNYRPVEGSSRLSRHALGLAVDINPLYNPYITYTENGEKNILPASASAYADRSAGFPYKIDENDLCYKLFIQHGFTWGGNWNNVKDYQHFQKSQ